MTEDMATYDAMMQAMKKDCDTCGRPKPGTQVCPMPNLHIDTCLSNPSRPFWRPMPGKWFQDTGFILPEFKQKGDLPMKTNLNFTYCPTLFSFLNESVHDKISIPMLRELMIEDGRFDHLIITGPGCSGKSTLEQFIKSVVGLNLHGIKSKVFVQSVIRDTPAPNLPAPFMNIHLGKEIPGDEKDPCFLSRLQWEVIDFAKWAVAREL